MNQSRSTSRAEAEATKPFGGRQGGSMVSPGPLGTLLPGGSSYFSIYLSSIIYFLLVQGWTGPEQYSQKKSETLHISPHSHGVRSRKYRLQISKVSTHDSISLIKFYVLFFYFERERESKGAGGRTEREGERESQAGSVLLVQSPTWGLNSQTMRS